MIVWCQWRTDCLTCKVKLSEILVVSGVFNSIHAKLFFIAVAHSQFVDGSSGP
jgi:hypothetical protein